MARILANTPDVQAPDADYLKGKILDQDNTANPPIPGTPIVERLYGDIVEFFQKLMSMAGITENDLSENETNGHQYIDALDDFVTDQLPSLAGKADKVSSPIEGNFAGLDSNGNLTDSGHKDADYDDAGAAGAVQGNLDTLTGTLGTAATKDVGVADGNVPEVATAGLGNSQPVITSTAGKVQTESVADFRTRINVFSKTESGDLLVKVMNIGNWNMDSATNIDVAHGITNGISKIVNARVSIIKDDSSEVTNLELSYGSANGGKVSWNDTNIHLTRESSGYFDSVDYDSASFNRGKIIIWYIA